MIKKGSTSKEETKLVMILLGGNKGKNIRCLEEKKEHEEREKGGEGRQQLVQHTKGNMRKRERKIRDNV